MNQLNHHFLKPRKGAFGHFGGMFVSELLVQPLMEVETSFRAFRRDAAAMKRFRGLLRDFAGRETPLFHARNLSKKCGFQIFLKREDLVHGGAHKTNNTLGQALLAQYMGKKEVIAETGAGQHGVAVAMTAALLGLRAKIFMGAKDVERQAVNVARMRLFGAEVIPVTCGSQTLKDAINEALRYYVAHSRDCYYIFGTAAGPHPFPSIVRFFQSVIGREARRQILSQTGKLPDYAVACVGGGSNAIGLFSGFLKDSSVKLVGVEPSDGASLSHGKPGILHGSLSCVLQNEDGQIQESHSISAGLDYPGVGPEHSHLQETQWATYVTVTDQEAVDAFHVLARSEGILPALESSHALAHVLRLSGSLSGDTSVLINLSGRGDKDISLIQSFSS